MNFSKCARIAGAVAVAAFAASATGSSAQAGVTLLDTYWGGNNYYNPANGDVIGDSNFEIFKATAARVGAGGNTLEISIYTNYAGAPTDGTGRADGTGYGSLFLTPGKNAWNPTGSAPQYGTDVYTQGEWQYAAYLPETAGASGSSGLYSIPFANAALNGGEVVGSHVGSDFYSHGSPNPGASASWYFRDGQAVQINPSDADLVAGSSWTITAGKITFDIVDNHLLGNDFALSWAMTCANDVIQGQIAGVPELSTWAMMIIGFGLVGLQLKRRNRAVAA